MSVGTGRGRPLSLRICSTDKGPSPGVNVDRLGPTGVNAEGVVCALERVFSGVHCSMSPGRRALFERWGELKLYH